MRITSGNPVANRGMGRYFWKDAVHAMHTEVPSAAAKMQLRSKYQIHSTTCLCKRMDKLFGNLGTQSCPRSLHLHDQLTDSRERRISRTFLLTVSIKLVNRTVWRKVELYRMNLNPDIVSTLTLPLVLILTLNWWTNVCGPSRSTKLLASMESKLNTSFMPTPGSVFFFPCSSMDSSDMGEYPQCLGSG